MIKNKIILGIDPGTVIMGFGLIHLEGAQTSLIQAGVVKLEALGDQPIRLRKIFQSVSELIKEHKPDEMAIEAPFYGKNVQSMLKLGRAQGVAIASALNRNIPIFEYSPKKVKQSITGNGNASKEQVSAMVMKLLNIVNKPAYFDATDALAVAICHLFQNVIAGKPVNKLKDWSAFLKANPGKKL